MTLDSLVILAGRIDGLGDNAVAGFYALQDWMPAKERAVVDLGFHFVNFAQDGRRRQQSNQKHESIPVHTETSTIKIGDRHLMSEVGKPSTRSALRAPVTGFWTVRSRGSTGHRGRAPEVIPPCLRDPE